MTFSIRRGLLLFLLLLAFPPRHRDDLGPHILQLRHLHRGLVWVVHLHHTLRPFWLVNLLYPIAIIFVVVVSHGNFRHAPSDQHGLPLSFTGGAVNRLVIVAVLVIGVRAALRPRRIELSEAFIALFDLFCRLRCEALAASPASAAFAFASCHGSKIISVRGTPANQMPK